MSALLKHTLIVRHPDTDAPTALVEGEPVPDWAEDLVQDDDLVTLDKPGTTKAQAAKADASDSTGGGDGGSGGDSADGSAPAERISGSYYEHTGKKLVAEITARNEGRAEADQIKGSGNKAALVKALEADDEAAAPAAAEQADETPESDGS